MANQSVLELAVGTGKWDAGLKKAKSALDNFTQANGGLQQALDKESQKMQKFVQMMGGMESTAKTAKGQMNDYKGTIEQLTMQYNRMSEAQKKTIGQDYLQAIEQMKQKYQSVNEEIQEMNRSLNNVKLPDMKDGGGGLFSGLGDKMSGALQVFAGNMLTKAAGAVANLGSEMYGMVQQGIELAKQGEGIRIAFERLGRGDILDGLRQATHGTVTDLELMKAAVKFNDFKLPLDELGTMLAFAQQKAKDTGQSVDYMVDSIVTGLGRKSLMILDNLGLSATEVKERMAETGDMTKAVGAIIREQMAKAGDYVETAADRAAQANVSLQNKMEELGRKFAPVEEASSQLWTSMKIGILDIIGGPLATLLNQLTEAGRLKNMLNNMNGEPGSGNTKVDQQVKKLNVIKKAGGSDYIFNSTLNGMLEDYNRQIAALDAKIKDTKKLSPDQQASKFVRDEVQKMSEQMKALGMMRDQLAAGAKELSKPVDVKIETKGAEQNVDSLKVKLIELEAQRKKAIAAGDTDLSKNLLKQINQTKADIKWLGGSVSASTTHKATPQGTAANKVKEAERIYAETLLKNSIRLDEGMDTTLEYKKRELSAQERLFDAYNDAYATYQDPAYKKASTEAAEKIRKLAGEVKAASDAQEAARKSARELDAAQRKLADAQQKLAEARATGSATAVYKAQQEVDKRQKVVEQVQYVADVKAGKMPTLPENMKAEMVVTANTDEAVRALQAIQGIKIDSKSFTVSTDDANAMARLREIRGIKIAPKSFTVSTDDANAMARLREIRGIKIAPKSFTVSTDDADAMARLREIDGVTIDNKTFSVSVNDADTLAKVREIVGVTIDDKTMTVTATTDEAVRALQAIQGIKIDSKSFTVSTDDANAMARLREIRGIKIAPKSFTVSTDDANAMARLREIRGIKIAPKSFTVSTDDADAMARLREIDGVTIDNKTFSVSVNDADTLAKVREIVGVTIDDKTMTVTATTDEAVRALQAIQGVMIQPKSFDISTDNDEALAKVSEIDGVTIGPKTFTVTADDEDVLAKLREILAKLSEIQGVTIDTKTFTISTDNEEALAKVREIQDLTIDPKTVKIVQDVSTHGEKSSFDNLVETVQAEIKFDQMKVDETALHTLLQAALQNGLDGLALSYEGIQEKIAKGIDIPDSTWEELYDEINEKLKAMGIDPIQIPIETVGKDVKAITKAASMAADAVGNIGAAFNAIEDPAAKVMGTVLQAIASIALGFAQASASPAVTSTGWGWLAWLGAGTAALATTVATVHSLTGYAEGGIIKGNSYSGDNIGGLVDGSQLVGLNAGEVVLNAAQQNTLAQNLQGVGGNTVNVVGRIRGTDIILSVDRTLSLEGKQLLTWGR